MQDEKAPNKYFCTGCGAKFEERCPDGPDCKLDHPCVHCGSEVEPIKCRTHSSSGCDCRRSNCCSRYTHGCGPINHKFFDPDFNGA